MPAPAARPRLLTVEQYLARERAASVRHEYVAGRVYAMSGETRAHNRIALNVAARLLAAARGTPCRVSVEDVKLRVRIDPERFYYPDVMVACGPPPDDPYLEDAPCLIVEVLSPSTRRTDQSEKGPAYRALPSLAAYVIVHQTRRYVEWYTRGTPPGGVPAADGQSGGWHVTDVIGDGAITFPCPLGPDGAPVTMTFDEIYEGAEPPPHPRPRAGNDGQPTA